MNPMLCVRVWENRHLAKNARIPRRHESYKIPRWTRKEWNESKSQSSERWRRLESERDFTWARARVKAENILLVLRSCCSAILAKSSVNVSEMYFSPYAQWSDYVNAKRTPLKIWLNFACAFNFHYRAIRSLVFGIPFRFICALHIWNGNVNHTGCLMFRLSHAQGFRVAWKMD